MLTQPPPRPRRWHRRTAHIWDSPAAPLPQRELPQQLPPPPPRPLPPPLPRKCRRRRRVRSQNLARHGPVGRQPAVAAALAAACNFVELKAMTWPTVGRLAIPSCDIILAPDPGPAGPADPQSMSRLLGDHSVPSSRRRRGRGGSKRGGALGVASQVACPLYPRKGRGVGGGDPT
jgi:hypothetical protein